LVRWERSNLARIKAMSIDTHDGQVRKTTDPIFDYAEQNQRRDMT
jgi:hypothetical protein